MTVASQLYPEILFHFTKALGTLTQILTEGSFRLSYAKEKLYFGDEFREYVVPMVSFCDLRLSECKAHAKSYGAFGVGLSKPWAIRNGLNPVIYLNPQSPLCRGLFPALDETYQALEGIDDVNKLLSRQEAYMDLFELVRYGKNYEGMLKRGDKGARNYRFANEREWRYVPYRNAVLPIVRAAIVDKPAKKLLNDRASHVRLRFKAEDVRYLIVKSEMDRAALVKKIGEIQGSWTQKQRSRLTARILTMKQIKSDF